ncbi:MAG: hypothetical protein QM731_14585 [Chitinophagaceae bacterium]
MLQKELWQELLKINELLRNRDFTITLAAAQEEAYYRAQDKEPPPFLTEPDTTITKSRTERKVAAFAAGFYALECGIGALIERKGQTPVYWLHQIIHNQLGAGEALLLNRFANAAWKASQLFFSLDRITGDGFVAAALLNSSAVQKDASIIRAAAPAMLRGMKGATNSPLFLQVDKVAAILKDKQFALTIAKHIFEAPYIAIRQPPPPFIEPGEDGGVIEKSANEEKIAVNAAALYALEGGLSYFVTAENKFPSAVLASIINNTISPFNKRLLERFANATWKASQPFRSFDRIERDTFTAFDLLSEEEVEKDWVQVKTAANHMQAAF